MKRQVSVVGGPYDGSTEYIDEEKIRDGLLTTLQDEGGPAEAYVLRVLIDETKPDVRELFAIHASLVKARSPIDVRREDDEHTRKLHARSGFDADLCADGDHDMDPNPRVTAAGHHIWRCRRCSLATFQLA